jgi:putative endonuclease
MALWLAMTNNLVSSRGGFCRGDLLAVSVYLFAIIARRLAMERQYCIYIITNKNNTTLYTGVTGHLAQRIYQHKSKLVEGFSKKYNLDKLVYYECTTEIQSAIYTEKQIKAGSRKKKLQLIENMNPEWNDLYQEII